MSGKNPTCYMIEKSFWYLDSGSVHAGFRDLVGGKRLLPASSWQGQKEPPASSPLVKSGYAGMRILKITLDQLQ